MTDQDRIELDSFLDKFKPEPFDGSDVPKAVEIAKATARRIGDLNFGRETDLLSDEGWVSCRPDGDRPMPPFYVPLFVMSNRGQTFPSYRIPNAAETLFGDCGVYVDSDGFVCPMDGLSDDETCSAEIIAWQYCDKEAGRRLIVDGELPPEPEVVRALFNAPFKKKDGSRGNMTKEWLDTHAGEDMWLTKTKPSENLAELAKGNPDFVPEVVPFRISGDVADGLVDGWEYYLWADFSIGGNDAVWKMRLETTFRTGAGGCAFAIARLPKEVSRGFSVPDFNSAGLVTDADVLFVFRSENDAALFKNAARETLIFECEHERAKFEARIRGLEKLRVRAK